MKTQPANKNIIIFKIRKFLLFLTLIFLFDESLASSTVLYQGYVGALVSAKKKAFKKKGIETRIVRLKRKRHLHGIKIGPFKSKREIKKITKKLDSKKIAYRVDSNRRTIWLRYYFYQSTAKIMAKRLQKVGIKKFRKIVFKKRLVTYYKLVKVQPKNEVINFSQNSKEESIFDTDSTKSTSKWSWGGKSIIEAGASTAEVKHGSHFASAQVYSTYHPTSTWEFRLEPIAKVYVQDGENSIQTSEIGLEDTYIKMNGNNLKITIGEQTIQWGRVYENSPIDRLYQLDIRRYLLNDSTYRKFSQTALRLEYWSDVKFDFVFMPKFQRSYLYKDENIWNIMDKTQGRMLGLPKDAVLSALIQQGSLQDKTAESEAYAARFSGEIGSWDWGLTVEQGESSLPYFEINPQTLINIGLGQPITTAIANTNGPTFWRRYAKPWVYAFDVGTELSGFNWRMELAYFSEIPMTTKTYEYKTSPGGSWATSLEFFPGDKDLQVNLQLSGGVILTDEDILDQKEWNFFSGKIFDFFAEEDWSWSLLFSYGLQLNDVYVSPRIEYLGIDSHKIYISYHYFDGEEKSINGYFKENDMATLGWQYSF